MKILILSTPRSGSTSFLNAISKAFNLNAITIPDDFNYRKDRKLIEYIIKKESVVVRVDPLHELGIKLEEFISYFNQILLLTRENSEDHFISVANVYAKIKQGNSNIHLPYSFSDLSPAILEEFSKSQAWRLVQRSKELIYKLSYELNKDIILYENLFLNTFKINNFILDASEKQIKTFNATLHMSKKLRVDRALGII